MPSYTSFQCSGREALFLFQLMNIPEVSQLLADLKDPASEDQAEHVYNQVITNLVKDGVIEVDKEQITLHPEVHHLLNACKLASAITRLDLHAADGTSSVSYGFLSGMQMVEWVWEPEQDQAVLTSFDELQDMFQVLGNRVELPDQVHSNEYAKVQVQEPMRTPIQGVTLQRLFELEDGLAMDTIESVLQQDQHMDQTLNHRLVESFATLEKQGQFEVYTRGMEGESQRIFFVGSPKGNWLFLKGQEDGLCTAFSVTEEEFVQSLFLLTTGSISVLPTVS